MFAVNKRIKMEIVWINTKVSEKRTENVFTGKGKTVQAKTAPYLPVQL